jgi:WD40 repeat protein
MEWDVEANQCKKIVQYHGDFDIFDINSSGSLLAYGSLIEDNSIIIWDVKKQVERCRVPAVDYGRFVSGQDTLAIFRDQKMVFFDTSTCQTTNELSFTTIGTNLAFSLDGERFAVADESILVVDTDTGTTISKIPYPEDARPYNSKLMPSGIEFSPDGKYLLLAFSTGAYSGRIQLWQISD